MQMTQIMFPPNGLLLGRVSYRVGGCNSHRRTRCCSAEVRVFSPWACEKCHTKPFVSTSFQMGCAGNPTFIYAFPGIIRKCRQFVQLVFSGRPTAPASWPARAETQAGPCR